LHVVSNEQCPALFESTIAGGGIALMDSTTTDDEQVGIGAFGDNLCFRAGGDADGNMRLHSTGNLTIGGNLSDSGNMLDVRGDAEISGYVECQGQFYHRANQNVLNKAANGWIRWVSRNTDEAETRVDLEQIRNIIPASGGGLILRGNTTINGDLAVDTNTLFVDASTNRVGIGTSEPDFSLDVNGNIGVTGFSQVFAERGTNVGTNPTLTLTLKSDVDTVGAIYCLDLIVSFGTSIATNPSSAKIVYMFTTSRTSGVTTISNITNMDTITAGSITSISTNTSGNTISFVFNGAEGARVSAQGRIVYGNSRAFVGFLSADWS